MTFAQKVYDFYLNLNFPENLPSDVEVMNPYLSTEVQERVKLFLNTYFNDENERVFVFGINPGRFGAGITGVTFTDPVALEECCKIPNDLQKKRELSSEFIYKFIDNYGGVDKFYSKFFLTAISPLGFIKNGINYNYYDDKELLNSLFTFIAETTRRQMELGANRKKVILLGTGKNQKFFTDLNKRYKFFDQIYALEHPRFIMQYKRKYVEDYISKYIQIFDQASV